MDKIIFAFALLALGAARVHAIGASLVPEALHEGTAPTALTVCREAGIKSLQWSKTDTREYCTAEAPLDPLFVTVVGQLREANLRMAQFVGFQTIDELMPDGLTIQLRESVLASPSSSSSTSPSLRNIFIGVHLGWQGEPINLGIYVHELGHMLTYLELGSIKPFLEALHAHPLMIETTADLIALSVVGTLMSTDTDVPACLDHLRYITSFQSYEYGESYFDGEFTMRRIERCCHTLLKSAASDPVSLSWKASCQDSSIVRSIESLPPVFSHRPVSATPPDATGVLGHGLSYDTHQIGVPISSFFVAVSKRTGIPMADLVFQALQRGSAVAHETQFVCGLDFPELPFSTRKQTYSAMALLDGLAESLRGRDLEIFDEEWKRHGLDYARAVDAAWLPKIVKTRFAAAIRKDLRAAQHPCWQSPWDSRCTVSCVQAVDEFNGSILTAAFY